MRRKFLIAAALFFAVVVAGVLHLAYRPVQADKPIVITIRRGENTGEIAAQLDREGLLRSKRLFIWWAKLRHIDRRLQPGRYIFSGPTAMSDLLSDLHQGKAVTVTVTIPEGLTIARIAALLTSELGVDSAETVKLTTDKELLARWAIPQDNMEGYLLPETYTFFWGVGADEVIGRMLAANRALFEDTVSARLAELGWSRHEALTLASMIEAEAGNNSERRRISAVFHNRLRREMLLQCDPTVIYAMGGLSADRQLLRDDLGFESPYNTYLYPGLPPGPICNPGKASILAAVFPDDSKELYFVADGAGGHIFTASLEEHNSACARVRREKRNR